VCYLDVVTLVYVHQRGCRFAQLGDGSHDDAAKRAADAYNLHRIAGGDAAIGKVIAVKLADGTSDGVAYANKSEAVAHQRHNERYCMFVRIRATSMTVCEAASLLRSARMCYDLGAAQADRDHPKGGLQLISRLTLEDAARQDAALYRALRRR
jgi:hypothetical protein